MKLSTKYNIDKTTPILNYDTNILTIGSCFSEHIGQNLVDSQFTIEKNPLGTLYHPIVIFSHLKNALKSNPLKMLEPFYLEKDSHYFNYYCHSSIYGKTKQEYEEKYLHASKKITQVLKSNGLIIITLGTAFGYTLKQNENIIVGNCHKQNNSLFKRSLSPVLEIAKTFKALLECLKIKNYNPTIIFTLSPVRHLKDGLDGNFLSKAHCRIAIDEILKYDDRILYFPAYEIMMDELRDYRYYADDLIHPNTLAQKIIWNYFLNQYAHKEISVVIDEWNKVIKTITHRPRIITKSYILLLNDTKNKLKVFNKHFNTTPFKDLLNEKIRIASTKNFA